MLRELQQAYTNAMFDGEADAAISTIAGPAVDARTSLAIHRTNILASLVSVLRAAYPALAQDLGEKTFHRSAAGFIRSHPPRRPELWTYGLELPSFIAALPEVATRPHLPDLARLEWAAHEAYFATDAPPLDPAALAGFPADRVDRLRFVLHDSVYLLGSRFSVLPIRTALLAGQTARARGEAEADHYAIVWRQGTAVQAEPLSGGAFTLALALKTGRPLGEAAAAANLSEPEFDLRAALAAMLSRQVFTAYSSIHAKPEETS